MLSDHENEIVVRVGPGTLMGDLMRQYWLPALLPSELPETDGRPVPIRLLGEDLIAFRDSEGRVGLLANNCPHRGASLFFGRNEESGLRCVYHGWKFDVGGRCVDMPNEPPESNFKDKVHAVAYPCIERNQIIWAYMGPRESPPPLPDFEANLEPGGNSHKYLRDCSWLQSFEGDLDTVHLAFLHHGSVRAEDLEPGTMDYYSLKNRWARWAIKDTEVGATYGAYRPAEEGTTYWRIAHYLFPFHAMIPTGVLGKRVGVISIVPIDDEHSFRFTFGPPQERSGNGTGRAGALSGAGQDLGFQPDTAGPLGRFRLNQSRSNDYMLDWEAQMAMKSYTGIPGTSIQDQAVVESMGQIYNRSHEHLGTSDMMIIRLRRLLIQAARDLREDGTVPPGVDCPEGYRRRSGGIVLEDGVEGIDATMPLQTARVELEDFDLAVATTTPAG
ncbi:MAG TPA: Rieske 2Fe-2S domain-containing protein [Dehalococcoidia bacterium]|nr:Rieske 2Fe-2S domain-containing protein [Dehalococcoidia bacterium]